MDDQRQAKEPSKAHMVYAAIRENIVTGRSAPGFTLDEADLARAFKVSRTPVREALRQLQREGLVELGSRRQLIVCTMPETYRNEVALLREALEGLAVQEACKLVSNEDIDNLRLALIRQRRLAVSDDSDGFLYMDEEFHRTFAGIAGMTLLNHLLSQLGPFVHLVRVGATDRSHMLGVVSEHDHLVDLLEARDERGLHRALVSHIHNTNQRHSVDG